MTGLFFIQEMIYGASDVASNLLTIRNRDERNENDPFSRLIADDVSKR